ncbi:hypothetical protein GOP47_0027064, partial [Adiantum capillus-veneris]
HGIRCSLSLGKCQHGSMKFDADLLCERMCRDSTRERDRETDRETPRELLLQCSSLQILKMGKLLQQPLYYRTQLTLLLLLALALPAAVLVLLLSPNAHQLVLSPFPFISSSCTSDPLSQMLSTYTTSNRKGPSSSTGRHNNNISSLEGLLPPPHIPLQELFSTRRTPTAFPRQFAYLSASDHPNFTSYFLPFPSQHKQHAIRNACIEPGGRLLLVNVTPDDLGEPMRGGGRRRPYHWYIKYANCGNVTEDECVGVRYVSEIPTFARYVPGNTMHLIAYYRRNTMHNFAERVWPRLALAVSPFNETTEGLPVDHFIFHKVEELLKQAAYLDDKDQVLWQFRMLMELWPGSDLLREEENETMCFDTLLLQMYDEARMDRARLLTSILEPSVRNYRAATFHFLKLPMAEIPLPPRPLRLLYYGRSELSRRRIVNHDEVLHFLQHNLSHRLHLEIRSLDLLLLSKKMNYSFTHLVSIFSQTDIFVAGHGAITWATIFMPLGSGFIEVFGSCDWWKSKEHYNDTTNLKTWVAPLTQALHIKHDLSNPYAKSVANPHRGNTTLCVNPGTGVPDYTIDPLKLRQVVDSFAYPEEPGDRLTLHWLYDWGHAQTP